MKLRLSNNKVVSIFNQLVRKRIEEFNQVNPEGAGKYNIKPGQLVISELHPTPVGINGEILLCYANWKPTNKSVFYKGQSFKFCLDNLYKHPYTESRANAPEALVGELILAYEPGVLYSSYKKDVAVEYNLKWDIIQKEPEYVTPENAGLYVFMSNMNTLGEMVKHQFKSNEHLEWAAYDEGNLYDEDYLVEDYDLDEEATLHQPAIDTRPLDEPQEDERPLDEPSNND